MMDTVDDLETELIDPKVQESLRKGLKMRLPRITRYYCDRINGMLLEQALDNNLITVRELEDIYLTLFELSKEFGHSKRLTDMGFRRLKDEINEGRMTSRLDSQPST
jgi:hypothetical protein